MAADLYTSMLDRWPINNLASDPARIAVLVTPDDNLDIPNKNSSASYAKSLYIGVTGDVNVILVGDKSAGGAGTAVLFKSHPVGYLPCQVRRVLNTSTTAQSILALFD